MTQEEKQEFKYLSCWGRNYTCGNKYACINNNKKKNQ